MRLGWIGLGMLALAGCGGGGTGDTDRLGDAAQEQAKLVDFLQITPGGTALDPLLPKDRPKGRVTMTGGFGARIGGTDGALYGKAEMEADFDAARVQGTVTQPGIYTVDLHKPILESTPELRETLQGRLTFDGAIETNPTIGEALWFDADFTGTLTGPYTVLNVKARVDRGSFAKAGTDLTGYGSVAGSTSVQRGGVALYEPLREGRIFVSQ